MEDIASFVWYARPDQFEVKMVEIADSARPDSELREVERTFVDFDIRNGRTKHRWVPKSQAEAIRYLLYHEDAAGLRKASDKYYLVTISPEEPLENLTEKYEKSVPSGYRGAVIPVPFTKTLMKGSKRDPVPKFSAAEQKLISLESEKDLQN